MGFAQPAGTRRAGGVGALLVNEIFHSIQGESTRAGIPSAFVRLAGCNLRCNFCDTAFAYDAGHEMSLPEIVEAVAAYHCHTVEITGGEPMMQKETPDLAVKLIERGFHVMVETNGTYDISALPEEAVKIVDIKCPDSGEEGQFNYANLKHLTKADELKFVISSPEDFRWAMQEVERHNLTALCTVDISPAAGKVSYEDAANLILLSGKNLRLNLPLHKIIWGDKRGV